MPTYHYRAVDSEQSCEACSETFAVTQSISDDKLEVCPKCEAPIRRVIRGAGAAVTNQRWNSKKMLSDGNLKKLGFKKLVKESDGKYVDVLQDK